MIAKPWARDLVQGAWKPPNAAPPTPLIDRGFLFHLRPFTETAIRGGALLVIWVPISLTKVTATPAQQPTSLHCTHCRPSRLQVRSSTARPSQPPPLLHKSVWEAVVGAGGGPEDSLLRPV